MFSFGQQLSCGLLFGLPYKGLPKNRARSNAAQNFGFSETRRIEVFEGADDYGNIFSL